MLTNALYCDRLILAHSVLRCGGVFVARVNDDLISDATSEKIIKIAERIALKEGANNVTVRKILRELNVTNRVFYNRFHNIEEVLEILYRQYVLKLREVLASGYDVNEDFFDYAVDVSVKALISTYDIKEEFSNYSFEYDSKTDENRIWWMSKIKGFIELGKKNGYLKDVDSDMLSYIIWCFFRGYNADAVRRRVPKDEAVESIKYGLECIFNGVKKSDS